MKRLFTILFILISVAFSVFGETDPPCYQYLVGYVNRALVISVTINEAVLPFNLDGEDVKYNEMLNYVVNPNDENPETISRIHGLNIGTYTLISNFPGFNLYVSHSPLVLKSGNVPSGKLGTIDYRLYLVLGSGDYFYSSLSCSTNPETPKTANPHIVISGSETDEEGNNIVWVTNTGYLSIVEKSIFVSLEDGYYLNQGSSTIKESTEAVLNNLAEGSYESYIYFQLEGS